MDTRGNHRTARQEPVRPGSDGRRSAIVVGGGVGGLAAAIGLRRIGWTVTVLERAPELRAAGSGWSFARNGERAADALGFGEPFRACSVPTQAAGSWSSSTRCRSARWLASSGVSRPGWKRIR